MSHGRPQSAEVPISLQPEEGWHCTHIYYAFDRAMLTDFPEYEIAEGRIEICDILDPETEHAPTRLQTSIVPGHKADFGLMLMDPDPLKIDRLHQRLMSSQLGATLEPVYSYVSISEISEYVPTVEQYGKRLIEEGDAEGSAAYLAKLKAYEQREVMMRKQRLTPDFPEWPATCFYPMNKLRVPGANWFMLDFDTRNQLMAEHGRSGMKFGGKVTQLITVGVGLDDWEWGVTLWAKNPDYLKDIVYKMRFDEASAAYAEFGPFYTSYISTPEKMLDHCQIG